MTAGTPVAPRAARHPRGHHGPGRARGGGARRARGRRARRERSSAPAGAWRSSRRSAGPTRWRRASASPRMAGTHGIGHTRMATESAVTTDGAHPFSTGPDQCLVHNGSLSNHNAVRRELVRDGLTLRDRERHRGRRRLSHLAHARGRRRWARRWRPRSTTLDGFYTFVVGTESGFGVLRDPIACKPAVMAETDRWVAFGTEYRALVDLPGIEAAQGVGAGAGHGLSAGNGTDARRSISPRTPLRELNAALHRAQPRHQRDRTGACSIRAASMRSRSASTRR